MSCKKPKTRIGWLYSFLSLFVRQPCEQAANRPNLDNSAVPPSTTMDASTTNPVLQFPAQSKKTFDWEKAREFQLAARLSVDRKLNRPKLVETKSRRIKSTAQPTPQWQRATRPAIRPSGKRNTAAVVIAFPGRALSTSDLSQAA